MNPTVAYLFVFRALSMDMRRAVMLLADEDLQTDRPYMDGWMQCGAGEYRDLELTLELFGCLDAPL